jgi:hypothetical protein
VKPGYASTPLSQVSRATNLGHDANPILRFIAEIVVAVLAGHVKFLTTPERIAQVITNAVLNPAGVTGVYFDEKGDRNPFKCPPAPTHYAGGDG